jgi:hypothetical protein
MRQYLQNAFRAGAAAARQMLAIARATFAEAIQQPAAFLVFLTSELTVLLVPVFQFHRIGEEGRLARDSGLSMLLLAGLVLAAGTAGSAVAREISRGTAAAILSKPVSRGVFVVAKWLGCSAVATLFSLGMLGEILLAERSSAHSIVSAGAVMLVLDVRTLALAAGCAAGAVAFAALRQYFGRKRFGAAAFWGLAASPWLVALAAAFYDRGGSWHGFPPAFELNARVLPAAVLVWLALLIFAALATALAVRFRAGTVLAVSLLVLLGGLMGDTFALGASPWSFRGLLAGVLPDVQHFWLGDALAHGGRIAWSYVAEAGGYAALCAALFLTAGSLAFRNRDLG